MPNKIKVVINHKNDVFLRSSLRDKALLEIKIDAAGIAGNQQLGNLVAEILKKTKIPNNQQREKI